jgi:hypothetical protein
MFAYLVSRLDFKKKFITMILLFANTPFTLVIFCLSDFVTFLAESLGKFAKQFISSVKLTNFSTDVFGTFRQFSVSQN